MAELGDAIIGEVSEVQTEGVLVEMLDYEYIEKCDDVKQLKAILAVLQSGKEGFYPHLTKTVEDKLLSLLPDKERTKISRIKQQATPQDIRDAEEAIAEWQRTVVKKDLTLKEKADVNASNMKENNSVNIKSSAASCRPLPPVRGTKPLDTDKSNDDMRKLETSPALTKAMETLNELEKQRILEISKTNATSSTEYQNAAKRINSHRRTIEDIWLKSKYGDMTGLERSSVSERERAKGNEFYRAGENDKAYDCYSISIALDPRNAITFANRAMTCIRLEKFESAEDDCSRALIIDPTYIKAWSRRGMTRFKRGKYLEAACDFVAALRLDPNNKELIALFEKAKEKYQQVEGKEITIEDISMKLSRNEKDLSPNGSGSAIDWSHQGDVSSTSRMTPTSYSPREVSSMDELLLPSSNGSLISKGQCSIISTPIERLNPNNTSETAERAEDGYTRVQITEEDDSEAEEDDEGFTRIQISVDDEDESDLEDVTDALSPVKGNITEAVSEDGQKREDPSIHDCEDWKNKGNELLSQGKASEAVEAYSRSLAINSKYIAARSNRVMAYIQLQMFEEAIKDADEILLEDSNHAKALYRRALASQSLADRKYKFSDDNWSTLTRTAAGDLNKLKDMNLPNSEDILKLSESVTKAMNAAAISWKDVGNDMMKNGSYEEAIRCYSKAMELDETNILFFNNRSQAYLKLNQYVSAEKDANVVIATCEKIQEKEKSDQYKKALFRRALARRGMGSSAPDINGSSFSLLQCIEDLKLLLSLEPGNKAAEIELAKSNQLLQEQRKAVTKSPKTTQAPSSVKADESKQKSESQNDLEMKPVATRRRVKPTEETSNSDNAVKESIVVNDVNMKPVSPVKIADESTVKSNDSIGDAKKLSTVRAKESNIPTEPPKTEYEFERVWRSLRTQPALFMQYVSTFKSSTFRKVFKAGSISSDLLSSMLHIFLDFTHVHTKLVGMLLESLAEVNNFGMILILMPEEDLKCVQAIIAKLRELKHDCSVLERKYKSN